MPQYTPKNVVQILTKQKGRELIMSAPLEKFNRWANNSGKKSFNPNLYHIVSIMNNSLQVSVLSQLTVLTLFNDTCSECGKTFTHYIIVEKTNAHQKCMKHKGKKLYQIVPCTIEEKNGEIFYQIFTKDHIIPQAKFGANNLENYQLMCCKCNIAKGCSASDDEYKYGKYQEGIFNLNINLIKSAVFGKKKHLIKYIERTKGGLFYIEFDNFKMDGYYKPSGENVLNKGIVLKNVLDN